MAAIKTLKPLPSVAGTLTCGLTHFVRILAHMLAPLSLKLCACTIWIFNVFEIALITVIATILNALTVEFHCRFQTRHIAKQRTVSNLIKHYLLMLPFILGMLLFLSVIQTQINKLGISAIKESLVLLGLVILFLSPFIYIMDWRYPGLVSKMEIWRKGVSD